MSCILIIATVSFIFKSGKINIIRFQYFIPFFHLCITIRNEMTVEEEGVFKWCTVKFTLEQSWMGRRKVQLVFFFSSPLNFFFTFAQSTFLALHDRLASSLHAVNPLYLRTCFTNRSSLLNTSQRNEAIHLLCDKNHVTIASSNSNYSI